MKFLVDMPLSPTLAVWLRDQGYDAGHALEFKLERASDEQIFQYARQETRTIMTADLDYPRLLSLARAAAPSLILFRSGNWSDADIIARMNDVLSAIPPMEIAESIIVVDRYRIRRRKLPILP